MSKINDQTRRVDFQFIDDIRLKVCKDCSKSDANGKCVAAPGTECVLERYLPQITKALGSVHGGSVNDYLVSLRTEVCAACGEKSESGYCYTSDSFGCPLETFFQIVAKAAVEHETA